MHYAPGREACPLPSSPFKACTVPRPIGWLSTILAKGVAESPAHFECRDLSTTRPKGNSSHGWVDVVFGEVVRIPVKDAVLTAEGKLDYAAIQPLARVDCHDCTSFSDIFTMPIPGAGGAAAGLEGKA